MHKGIDISEWQSGIDYKAVAASGIKFACLRSSYRQTIDKRFLEHVKGMKSARIEIPAVYHFAYPLKIEDAKKEAAFCISCVEKAGLPKSTIIFYDFEGDTVANAKKKGVKLGANECDLFTRAFCDAVEAAGYTAGVYCNLDYYKNMYKQATLDKYVVWLADLSGEADKPCLFHQYSFKGKVPGISGNVDLDYWYPDSKKLVSDNDTNNIVVKDEGMTENELRNKVASYLNSYKGISEGSTKHRELLSIFNGSKLCTRYTMTTHDAWCATAVSAVFIALGLAGKGKLFDCVECSCPNMISLAKKQGIWTEADSITPKVGDIIMYDWQDSGKGDNTGVPDHVGIVQSVKDGKITVIEGNKANTVGVRTIAASGRYIRGYIQPKYASVVAVKKIEVHDKEYYVKALQEALNVSYKLKLKVNGKLDDDTLKAIKAHSLLYKHPVVKNAHVSWLQECFVALGYDIGTYGVDGSCGPDMNKAICKYQKDHKDELKQDGIAGKCTHKHIIKKLSEKVAVSSE